MPAAIDFATIAAISPRSDGKVVLTPRISASSASLPLPAAQGAQRTLVRLSARGHFDSGGRRPSHPAFSLSLWGDVPLGSGLSSSAALEVATALAVSTLGVQYPGPQLRLCQRAENEFVGSSCGIMDQFISANAAKDHALLLDCSDLSFRLAPIPRRLRWLLPTPWSNTLLPVANTQAAEPRWRKPRGHRTAQS